MNSRMFGVALLAAVLVVPALGQEQAKGKKKGNRDQQNNAVAQLLKQLEPVGLTDAQVAKVKELGKAAAEKTKAIHEEAGITPELIKKRTDAQKSMKDSGKKGKELAKAVDDSAGLTETQAAAIAKSNEVRMKLQKDVIALLTAEQKENLPENMQRAANADGKAKGKGKKKKDAQ